LIGSLQRDESIARTQQAGVRQSRHAGGPLTFANCGRQAVRYEDSWTAVAMKVLGRQFSPVPHSLTLWVPTACARRLLQGLPIRLKDRWAGTGTNPESLKPTGVASSKPKR